MAFVENPSDFINDDTPGYTLALLNGVEVPGIFDDPSASGLGNSALGSKPTFSCSTVSADRTARGKTLIANGVTYIVRETEPDGTGFILLILEES